MNQTGRKKNQKESKSPPAILELQTTLNKKDTETKNSQKQLPESRLTHISIHNEWISIYKSMNH